jgi:uncharacterized protein with PhoU and TrkA domain
MTSLNPYLTIERQMTEVLEVQKNATPKAARSRAQTMLEAVQIADPVRCLKGYPHQFSGGMRQRIMIAMALLCEPDLLIADLSNAEEVSHRVWIREGSHMAHRPLKDLEIPVQCGMRVVAIRRDRSWMIEEIDGDLVLVPGDVLFLRGSPAGIVRLHELAAAPTWQPPEVSPPDALTDLDRAVDVLVEMKNVSEAAVGLAYSALALQDAGLAAEVNHLAERLDGMKDHLQLWVLRAAKSDVDPSPLRGLLQLASAAEELGDQASAMVWLITDDYEVHPIVTVALGQTEVVATRVPVAAGSVADGRRLSELQFDIEPGFQVLAVRRDNRYLYRPRGYEVLEAGDDIIAIGPHEGRDRLGELCGWRLVEDEDDPTALEVPAALA